MTPLKRRRMARLALEYAVSNRLLDAACRFDVVSIHFGGEGPVVDVYQNAFDLAGA